MSQASSRNPSPAPQREASVPRGRRSRSASVASSASDASSQGPRRNRRRRQNKQQLQNIGEEKQGADQALTGNPLEGDPLSYENEAGKLPGVDLPALSGGKSDKGSEEGGKDTLKLRLDLNLEVDIRITARVHGDVTLSLLNS